MAASSHEAVHDVDMYKMKGWILFCDVLIVVHGTYLLLCDFVGV